VAGSSSSEPGPTYSRALVAVLAPLAMMRDPVPPTVHWNGFTAASQAKTRLPAAPTPSRCANVWAAPAATEGALAKASPPAVYPIDSLVAAPVMIARSTAEASR
jgi:hypothetical protein